MLKQKPGIKQIPLRVYISTNFRWIYQAYVILLNALRNI